MKYKWYGPRIACYLLKEEKRYSIHRFTQILYFALDQTIFVRHGTFLPEETEFTLAFVSCISRAFVVTLAR